MFCISHQNLCAQSGLFCLVPLKAQYLFGSSRLDVFCKKDVWKLTQSKFKLKSPPLQVFAWEFCKTTWNSSTIEQVSRAASVASLLLPILANFKRPKRRIKHYESWPVLNTLILWVISGTCNPEKGTCANFFLPCHTEESNFEIDFLIYIWRNCCLKLYLKEYNATLILHISLQSLNWNWIYHVC